MRLRRQLSALLLGVVGGVVAGLVRRRPAPAPAVDADAAIPGTVTATGSQAGDDSPWPAQHADPDP